MKKKVIALAVAGVLAAPMAAQAGVEIYGKARLSVGGVSNDGSDTTAKGLDKDKMAVSSHASRIGFKGTEDLGDGLKALWQIERSVDFSDRDTTLGVRNTFLGVAGNFGTALLGAHDTPYKIATGSLDPFADTFGDYNAVIDSTHDVRPKNVAAYISPAMNGFTVTAAYVTDFADDNLKDTTYYYNDANNNGKQDTGESATKKLTQSAISLAGMYSAGPLSASLAYQSVSSTEVADSVAGNTTCVGASKCGDTKAIKLGVGYKIEQFNLGFVYESVDLNDKLTQKNTYVSGVMDLGGGMNLKAAIGQKGNQGSTKDSGASFFALGAGKSLSKNTEVYALYSTISNDKGAGAIYGLGVGNQPVAAAASSATSDAKASAYVIGINHSFSSM